MTTERLFDSDPYADKFTAAITYIGEDYLILDKTLFYPESGNQAGDTGYINNVTVKNTQLDDKDNIYSNIRHYMDVSSFQVGQSVSGCIDSEKRQLTMRLHSAGHIVEYVLSQWPSYLSSEGSFVSHEKDRTDYLLRENITAESIKDLEGQVNDFISRELPIIFQTEGNIRYWICDTITMKCCGTHVSNTREIGPFRLTRKNKGKGLNRVETYLLNN